MFRTFAISLLFLSQNLFAQPFEGSDFDLQEVPRFIQVNSSLARGGRPVGNDLQELKSMGFKTIINLDDDVPEIAAEKTTAESLGLRFISVPLNSMQSPKDSEIDFILAQMVNPENFPVYIHCQHGRDRTGLLVGLYRVFVDSWTPRAAYKEMKDLGFRPILFALKNYFSARTNFDN